MCYPNPASESFTVSGRQSAVGGQQSINIRVSNMIGVMIDEVETVEKENWKISIDVSDYQPGIYFVTVFDNDHQIFSKKLIIIK